MQNLQQHDIEITAAAFEQIDLVLQNDFTLEDHLFRIKIDGKGCAGFTYATGFSQKVEKDVERIFSHPMDAKRTLTILFDDFTAFYLKKGKLDYLVETESNEDGFVVTNSDENSYHGKFYKDESKIPL